MELAAAAAAVRLAAAAPQSPQTLLTSSAAWAGMAGGLVRAAGWQKRVMEGLGPAAAAAAAAAELCVQAQVVGRAVEVGGLAVQRWVESAGSREATEGAARGA